MFTSKTSRLVPVLAALLFIAACGEESLITDPGNDSGIAGQALKFEGPDRVDFEIGKMQSVSYYAEHSTGHDFDLYVDRAPAGADVSVSDLGPFAKRVTVNWNPDHNAEGTLHPVSLRASAGSLEWSADFGIYVTLTEMENIPSPSENDTVIRPWENKAVGTRK